MNDPLDQLCRALLTLVPQDYLYRERIEITLRNIRENAGSLPREIYDPYLEIRNFFETHLSGGMQSWQVAALALVRTENLGGL